MSNWFSTGAQLTHSTHSTQHLQRIISCNCNFSPQAKSNCNKIFMYIHQHVKLVFHYSRVHSQYIQHLQRSSCECRTHAITLLFTSQAKVRKYQVVIHRSKQLACYWQGFQQASIHQGLKIARVHWQDVIELPGNNKDNKLLQRKSQ